jgi:hypothetical protein
MSRNDPGVTCRRGFSGGQGHAVVETIEKPQIAEISTTKVLYF